MKINKQTINAENVHQADTININYTKSTNSKPSSYNPVINIGIICALDKELNAVKKKIENRFGTKLINRIDLHNNNKVYYECSFNLFNKEVKIIIIQQIRQGNTAAAIGYSYLTSNYELDFIAFCGIAGSLNQKIRIGDVIIPYEIFDTILKKEKADQELQPRGLVHKINVKLIGFISLLNNEDYIINNNFSIHCEPLLSDNTVIACEDSKIIKKVLQYNDKVAGVEMESAGLYEADYEMGKTKNGVITIRGISDNANHVKNDEFHLIASSNAAEVLCEFIKIYIDHWVSA